MSKRSAWLWVGVLVLMLTLTPYTSIKYGEKPACIVCAVLFLTLALWPIKRRVQT